MKVIMYVMYKKMCFIWTYLVHLKHCTLTHCTQQLDRRVQLKVVAMYRTL